MGKYILSPNQENRGVSFLRVAPPGAPGQRLHRHCRKVDSSTQQNLNKRM